MEDDRLVLNYKVMVTIKPEVIDAGVDALTSSDLSMDPNGVGEIRLVVLDVLVAAINEALHGCVPLEVEIPDRGAEFFCEPYRSP